MEGLIGHRVKLIFQEILAQLNCKIPEQGTCVFFFFCVNEEKGQEGEKTCILLFYWYDAKIPIQYLHQNTASELQLPSGN